MTAERLKRFGTTIFAEMTRHAQERGAINLSQGFPDFEGPREIIEAAVGALRSGHNQYARSMGIEPLAKAIAAHQMSCYGLRYDPLQEVIVFSGATEAIASALLGLIDPGDEVILFEPFYDSYPVCVTMAGGVARHYTLEFPHFGINMDKLERLINDRTRALVLNTPHNPTGKVFSPEELGQIAQLCCKHNLIVIADEVYEHITYDGTVHVPMATIEGMRERTLTISSAGKTYSLTGWKVGWATGPEHLVKAATAAHQFVTFATATPLQHAVAFALDHYGTSYYEQLRREYTQRRDFLIEVLRDVGLEVAVPRGAYFLLCDFSELFRGDDRAFAMHLIEQCRVAAIPPSVFYAARIEEGQRLVRFAFCKRPETLEQAAQRLRGLRSSTTEG